MADEGIFATTEEVQRKVGANASATSNTEAYINQFIGEVESQINAVARFNFSDNYAALNADTKQILKEIASNLAAVYVLNYDFSGIVTAGSLIEAEDRVVVLRDAALRGLSLLKDKKQQDFINGS
jgi:membrane-associated HD superfamily phosphohydrolase